MNTLVKNFLVLLLLTSLAGTGSAMKRKYHGREEKQEQQKKRKIEKNQLSDLPHEILWDEICSYLTNKDRYALSTTNKFYNKQHKNRLIKKYADMIKVLRIGEPEEQDDDVPFSDFELAALLEFPYNGNNRKTLIEIFKQVVEVCSEKNQLDADSIMKILKYHAKDKKPLLMFGDILSIMIEGLLKLDVTTLTNFVKDKHFMAAVDDITTKSLVLKKGTGDEMHLELALDYTVGETANKVTLKTEATTSHRDTQIKETFFASLQSDLALHFREINKSSNLINNNTVRCNNLTLIFRALMKSIKHAIDVKIKLI